MPTFQGKPVYRPVQMTHYGQGMTVAPPPVEYEDEEKKVASSGANPPNPPDDKYSYINNISKDKKKKFK